VAPNESPAETAVRETVEETGLSVDVRQLVGVYTRQPGEHGPHCLVVHLYLCVERGGNLETSHEGTELRYWHPEDVPEWHKNHRRLAGEAREAFEKTK
jgi:ADP-ribose pyrophosphatase YjhB (NUDIX family)